MYTKKINDDYYMLNIKSNKQTKTNIHHIVCFDDVNLYIIDLYIRLLKKYTKYVDIKHLHIMTRKYNYYSEIFNVNVVWDHLINDFETGNIEKPIVINENSDYYTQVIIFSKTLNNVYDEILNNENYNISYICPSYIDLKKKHITCYNYNNEEELVNMINDGIFLSFYNVNNTCIKSDMLFMENGALCINTKVNNIILLKNTSKDTILIENKEYIINKQDNNFNEKDIINIFTYLIKKIEEKYNDTGEIEKIYNITINKYEAIPNKNMNNIMKYQTNRIKQYLEMEKINNILQNGSHLEKLIWDKVKSHISDSSKILKKKQFRDIIIQRINYNIENRLVYCNFNTIKKIKEGDEYKNLISNNDNMIELSKGFYTSPISCTNWIDEMEYDNGTGLFIEIKTSIQNVIGINTKDCIKNVTTTFFSLANYIEEALKHNKIHKSIITEGNAIGKGNGVIPLYINKYHWKIANEYKKIILGIMFTNNPLGYTQNYDYVFFEVLTKLTCDIISKNIVNDKICGCFIACIRTCAQVGYEMKISYSIRKHINTCIKDYLKNSDNTNSTIMGECIGLGYILDKNQMQEYITSIIDKSIRYFLKNNSYNRDFYEIIINDNDNNYYNITEIANLMKTMKESQYFSDISSQLYSFVLANNIMNKIYGEFRGFNQFIKYIDNNYGILDVKMMNFFIQTIKSYQNDTKICSSITDILEMLGYNNIEERLTYCILRGLKINNYKSYKIWDHIDIYKEDINVMDEIKKIIKNN